ncbi:MAG: phosphate acyltransferase PlsX [Chloroflexota bacterium]
MRIVLDAMGSDTAPQPEVAAAAQARARWGERMTLTGPRHLLEGLPEASEFDLVDAPDVLEMTDKPAEAARHKPNTSMAVGMDLLKREQADAFVTAGNTGGAMATALFKLGRIKGVKRPALSPVIPVRGGSTVVIDIGANAECKPEYMPQFAIMGSIYAEVVLERPQPRVGLLSTGEEAGKGNDLVRESFPLLEAAGLNFIGNVEPKDLYAGAADVVVTDGFTGNIFLKTSEAVAGLLVDLMRSEIRASPVTAVGGLLARPAFRRVSKRLDPSEYGAVPLLGVDGLVFIGHGRSDARAMLNAIRVARQAVSAGLLQAMRDRLGTALRELPG